MFTYMHKNVRLSQQVEDEFAQQGTSSSSITTRQRDSMAGEGELSTSRDGQLAMLCGGTQHRIMIRGADTYGHTAQCKLGSSVGIHLHSLAEDMARSPDHAAMEPRLVVTRALSYFACLLLRS
jgi:hypothetical protein